MRKTRIVLSAVVASLAMTLLLGVPTASAVRPTGHKVTICHATNSVNNPYVQITVDIASAGYPDDGSGHDGHLGNIPADVAELQAMKDAGEQWGDVIPAYTYDGVNPAYNYPGLNLSPEGLALLENDCAIPDLPDELVKYRLVTRMPLGKQVQTLEAGLVPSITCDTVTNAYIVEFSDGTIVSMDAGTSRKGSILRIRSQGEVLVAVRFDGGACTTVDLV
ncbi:MAG: hypothetical protein WEA10_01000 [Actinomycetota bacterium]